MDEPGIQLALLSYRPLDLLVRVYKSPERLAFGGYVRGT